MTPLAATAPRAAIHRLSKETVEKIAAGEVVERPASVVKELVENAVDAGATEVRVHLLGGGLELIRVDDDGSGIPADELPLAVERYATSKISTLEDLAVTPSLGFRGEALAAIASVSHLTLTSRPPDSEAGHGVRVDDGKVVDVGVAGQPVGTTVEVRDLFFNTPARRKFLRSPAAEQVDVASTLERLYLARPDVSLLLTNASGELGRFPRTTVLRDALARVFGPEILAQSFEVTAELADGGNLHAVLARPSLSRPNSLSLHLAVNGRPVVSRALAQAVRAAFIDYLPRTRFPVGVVSLAVDPARVDPNVHPTKREVRLADERAIGEVVRVTVRSELARVPQASPARSTIRVPLRPDLDASLESRPALTPEGVPAGRAARQRALIDSPSRPVVTSTGAHPTLRILGSLFSLYWVAESDEGLVLIDQHAASERVVFEALRADGRLGRQELLSPVSVTLSASSRAALEDHLDEVSRAGFAIEPFGGDRYRVAAVPSYLGRRMPPEAVVTLLEEIANGGRPTVPDDAAARVAASIACHAAVRAGDVIEADELRRILERLYALPTAAYACPHGRPILVALPRGRLDRWFLREGE